MHVEFSALATKTKKEAFFPPPPAAAAQKKQQQQQQIVNYRLRLNIGEHLAGRVQLKPQLY